MSIPKIIIILVVVFSLTMISSTKLYDMVMVYERYSAGLEKKSLALDFGEIVYLENDVKNVETLVFIHGFGGNKDTWNRLVNALDDKYHVIVVDLPGHGESVSTKTLGYTTTHQAEMLNVFLEAKNIRHFYLFGHSMGGAIALRYVEHHADNLRALVLIDSMGMIQTKSDGVKLLEQSTKNPLYDVCTKERLDTLFSYSMYKPPYIPDVIYEALLEEKCSRRELEKVIYQDMNKDVNLSGVAKNIQLPTLILWGEKDQMTHVDDATLFHQTIKGSQLHIFKEVGHIPLLENPEKMADVIDTFISELDER